MSEADPAAMWEERYGPATFAYGLAPNSFLAAQRELLAPGMRALVPGDGEGRNGVWLAEQGLEVDTLDLAARGVEKSRQLAASRGRSINATQADALKWAWPSTAYDVVALIFLHLIAEQRRILHARVLSAVKPRGLVVLEAFRPEQIERQKAGVRGGPRDAALLYSVADLREDFAGQDILMLENAEADLSEGALHVGQSAVVRALLRRR